MKAWLAHNSHSIKLATERLLDTPFASLVSVLVIGIAISLPAGLYALFDNAERAAGNFQSKPEITLFLTDSTTAEEGRKVAQELAQRVDLTEARFIDKVEGLKSLEESGLAEITSGLSSNPLPHAIVLTPSQTDPAALDALVQTLHSQPSIDHIASDTDWAKRLAAILTFGQDLVWMLATLLGLALAAVTGNTIRLQIYALREEIIVSRLIGATDRFIRRPFLYFGLIQGLLGGFAGWIMVSGGLNILEGNVSRLAAAYGTTFQLTGLGLSGSLSLLGIAGLLGLAGAYVAVSHTLRSFD